MTSIPLGWRNEGITRAPRRVQLGSRSGQRVLAHGLLGASVQTRKPWEGLQWGGWSGEKAARPEPGCAAAIVRVRVRERARACSC